MRNNDKPEDSIHQNVTQNAHPKERFAITYGSAWYAINGSIVMFDRLSEMIISGRDATEDSYEIIIAFPNMKIGNKALNR